MLEARRVLATYVVDSLLDTFDSGDDLLTLREAVALAEGNTGPDTITFDASLAGGTIELAAIGDTSFGNSALAITTEITIDGAAAPGLAIGRSASQSNLRQFFVDTTGNLTLEAITVSGGRVQGGNSGSTQAGGSGGGGAGLGGAIFNRGTLNILDSTLSGNSATGGTAGTTSPGSIYAGSGGGGMIGSSNNSTGTTGTPGGEGGGGYGGSSNSSIGQAGGDGSFGGGGGGGGRASTSGAAGGSGGFGGGGGGGGAATTPGSGSPGGFGGGTGVAGIWTVIGGRGGGGAGMGGAIFNHDGELLVMNSTFSGNTATGGSGANNGQGLGGAIFGYDGLVALYNSTFAGNTANQGGGAFYGYSSSGETIIVDIQSTVMADSANAATDLQFTTVGGYYALGNGANFIENPANQYESQNFATNTGDAKLGTLADNGGPTQTIMPQAGSPLIGNGSMPVSLTTDQIGNLRETNGQVDIGAVQYVAAAPPVIDSIERTNPTSQATGSAQLVFTITFDVSVTGVDASQIQLTGTAAADCTIDSVSGSGSIYTVTVNNNQAVGTLGLEVLEGVIQDSNGVLFAGEVDSSETYTLDVSQTFVVDSLLDTVDANDNLLTLREAIALAEATLVGDTITFAPQLAGGTVELATVSNTDYGNSALTITTEILIDGDDAPGLVIGRSSSQTNLRQFYVTTTGILTLEDLTISGGQITGGSGASGGGYGNGGGSGGGGAGLGGAIYNRGVLNVYGSTLTNNSATGGFSGVAVSTPRAGSGGGGIAGNGSSALFNAPGSGGAGGGGTGGPQMTSGNDALFGGGGGGGGAGSTGNAGNGGAGGFGGGGGGGGGSIDPYTPGSGGAAGFGGGQGGAGSSLAFNVYNGGRGGGGAGMGGAIFNDQGTTTIVNSTLTGNSAVGGVGANNGQGLGGAVFTREGTFAIYNSTVAYNRADDGGGGVAGIANTSSPVPTFNSTVISNTLNQASDVLFFGDATTGQGANNFIRDAQGAVALSVQTYTGDPMLGSLADNGGPTQTIMPLAGSPLLNTGANPLSLLYDQIGHDRNLGGTVDIGAVQYFTVPVITSIVRTTPTDEQTDADSVTFTITFDEPVTGVDASQIELTGTAAADASITQVAGSLSTYTVTIDTSTAEGTLGLSVLTGVIANAVGILYDGTISAEETYTISHTPPLTVLAIGTNPGSKSKPIVNVYDANSGAQLSSILVYGSTFNGGVQVAVGDLTGDGIPEIVVTPASKRAIEVKVYTPHGEELTDLSFMAAPGKDKKGASVTVGDVNGDGWNDIITSSSGSQRAFVKVFQNNYGTTPQQAFSSTPTAEFDAFGKKYTSGVSLATGDVNDDGADEIIVGSNKGQVSQIGVFTMADPQVWTFTQLYSITPFGDSFKGGVSVSAGDVDGDGHADIIAGAGDKGNSQVQIFNGDTGVAMGSPFTAFSSNPKLPVNVAAKDLNGDGVIDEIFTAVGQDSADIPVKRYLTNGQPSPEGVDFVLESGKEFSYGLQIA